MRNNSSSSYSAVQNKFRVSYQISDKLVNGSETNNAHCFSVNALVIDEPKNILYTAGRDSTVRCWNVQEKIEHLYSFEHHSNWVNDLVLCNNDICKFSHSLCGSIVSEHNHSNCQFCWNSRNLWEFRFLKWSGKKSFKTTTSQLLSLHSPSLLHPNQHQIAKFTNHSNINNICSFSFNTTTNNPQLKQWRRVPPTPRWNYGKPTNKSTKSTKAKRANWFARLKATPITWCAWRTPSKPIFWPVRAWTNEYYCGILRKVLRFIRHPTFHPTAFSSRRMPTRTPRLISVCFHLFSIVVICIRFVLLKLISF